MSKSFLGAVALGTMLAPLNATMVAVVLSDIAADFGLELRTVSWVLIGYLIVMAVMQPISGRLGDLMGRRNLFLWAIAGFALSSIGAALSPNLAVLLAMRVCMAVTGAVAIPNGIAQLREHAPDRNRAAVFGVIGSAAGLAVFLGPLLGGVMNDAAGWRSIFWLNLPITAAAFYLAYRTFPHRARQPVLSFDLPGAVHLTGMLSCFALMAYTIGGSSAVIPSVLGIAAAAFAALFVWNELRTLEPLIKMRLLTIRSYSASLEIVMVSNAMNFGILFAVPLFIKEIRGLDARDAGYVLSALAIPVVLIPPFSGRLADKWGRRRPALLGGLLMVCGVAPMMFLQASWSPWLVAFLLLFVGAGSAMQQPAVQTSSVDSVRPEDAGMASGVFSTGRYVGTIIGTAVAAALLGSSDAAAVHVTPGRLQAVFMFSTALGVASTLGCLGLRGRGQMMRVESLDSAKQPKPARTPSRLDR